MKKTIVALCLLCAVSARAQTPLAKLFQDMHSDDPTVRAAARSDTSGLAEKEFPTIEKDTAVLCKALVDDDPYIRLQAAATMQVIVQVAPEHMSVVNACMPYLLTTALDHGEVEPSTKNTFEINLDNENKLRAREDALFALAMHPGGPSPAAQIAFVSALRSPIYRISELGAAGLIRESGPTQHSNHLLIQTTMLTTSDPKQKLNLLYAIAGSSTPSRLLFDASHGMLFDSDGEVQQNAVEAMAASVPDKAELLATMHTIAESPVSSKEVKMHAQGVICRYSTHP